MSEEIIKTSNTSNNNLAPALSYIGNKTRTKFDGNCIQKDKITFTDGKTVSIYNVYELSLSTGGYNDYPVLENAGLSGKLIEQFFSPAYVIPSNPRIKTSFFLLSE